MKKKESVDWGRIHLGYELPTTSYNLAFNISLLFSLIISYVNFAKKKEAEASIFTDKQCLYVSLPP